VQSTARGGPPAADLPRRQVTGFEHVERLARRSVYFFRDCFDAPENLIFERIEVARDSAWRFGYATSFNGIHTANS
jgi:hypothetical protein